MKTPEEMAEEYAEDKSKAYYIDQNGDQKWYTTERGRYSKEDFLAGYQAAQPRWISVKDRLPKEGQAVLLYNSLEYVSIVMANYYSDSKHPHFDHIILDVIHLKIRLADNMHLYWMPLPEEPKEEG